MDHTKIMVHLLVPNIQLLESPIIADGLRKPTILGANHCVNIRFVHLSPEMLIAKICVHQILDIILDQAAFTVAEQDYIFLVSDCKDRYTEIKLFTPLNKFFLNIEE